MAATATTPTATRDLAIVTDRMEPVLAIRRGFIAEAVRRGARVHVLGPAAPASHLDALRAAGAEPHAVPLADASGSLGARGRRRAIEAVLDRLAPTAALTMGPLAALAGAAASGRTGVRHTIVDVAGLGLLGIGARPSWLARQRARTSLARASAVIVDNEGEARALDGLGVLAAATRVVVLAAGGADVIGIEAAPLPPIGAESGPVALLIATGQSAERDRAEVALYRRAADRALGAIAEAVPGRTPPRLAIFGESGAATLPWAWHEAIDASHVVVIAGTEPAMPQALVDALAHGRAVIAARAPDRHRLIDEYVNGTMFEPGDAEDLARALILVLSRPAEIAAMARASRLKAERRLDARAINGELLELLGFPPRSA